MDINSILEDLQKVEDALKCNVCPKVCVEPVKVRACGHYFCLDCFKPKDHLCPKCKTYFEERDIIYDNIAKQSHHLILELKQCLLEPDSIPDIETHSRNDTVACESFTENTFVYNGKTYHVNYIDDKFSKVNAKGETPLHIACKKKRLNEVIQLIEQKCDINVKDFAGWAPIHEAVESGDVEIVETLLKNGVLIDTPGQEYVTALHKAVVLENEALIRLLLKYNADREALDYFGKKPIECSLNESIKSVFTEDITATSGIKELFCTKQVNVYLYYIEEEYKQKLKNSKLAKIVKEYDTKKVTHFLIRKTHKLSLKIMVAMLDGCFVLPQEWVDDFLKNNHFIPIPTYTFISKPELNNGIRKATLNSILKLPKLFDGINFYIQGHNTPVEINGLRFRKDSLSLLITSGGGKVLRRAPTPSVCEGIFNYPYHSNINGKISRCCHYLIYDVRNPPTLQYQMPEIKHKTSKWLVDCIVNFTIRD